METKQYTTIDRVAAGWPSGLWDNEPDKVQWQDDDTGMPCLAVRHSLSGHWCGYVGVSPSHKHFGKGYEEPNVSVHWGLTFADTCQPHEDESEGVCHVPAPGDSDKVWWFGFDCAHAYDCSPNDVKLANERGYPFEIDAETHYRTLEFVKYQCKSLAAQLALDN